MTAASNAARAGADALVYENERYSFSRKGPRKKPTPRDGASDTPLAGVVDTLYSEHEYMGHLPGTLSNQLLAAEFAAIESAIGGAAVAL